MKPRFHIQSTSDCDPIYGPSGSTKATRKPTPANAPLLRQHSWGQALRRHERRHDAEASEQGAVPWTVRGRR